MNPQFCPKCGNELPPQTMFCPKCGQSILPISQEYSIAQNNFKKAYFYWKLRGFLGLLIFSIACECFFGIEGISSKILTIIISSAAGIGIFKLLDDQITRLTNIELFYNPFREDPEDEKKSGRGRKVPRKSIQSRTSGAHSKHTSFSASFSGFLRSSHSCFYLSIAKLAVGFRSIWHYGLYFGMALLETGIWTFKWGHSDCIFCRCCIARRNRRAYW